MDSLFQLEPDVFQNTSQELLRGLYYTCKEPYLHLDADLFEKAKNEMRNILLESHFDKKKVTELFFKREAHQEKRSFFLNLIETNWSELLSAALNHYNSNYGETISSFDCLVKFVLGTSELKTLKYPLLQLVMSTVNKTGKQNRLMFDINKDMLLKLINTLENI